MELATTNRPARLEMLDALSAVGAILNAPKLVLLTGDIPAGTGLVPGDVTPVTGAGYADGTPVASAAYFDVESQKVLVAYEDFTFVASSGITGDIPITGWALMNTGKTKIGALYRYDDPVVLSAEGDGITVSPGIAFAM